MDENKVISYFKMQDDPFFSGKLSALYIFAEVSYYPSFRAAAKEMYVSPQALNKQITALEKKLQVPLIYRSPRGFTLTSYGEHVQKYASELLQNMSQLRHELTTMYTESKHMLRLAYTNNLYDTSLHMYMMDFQDEESTCKMKSKRLNFDQTMAIANGKEPYITIISRPSDTDKFDITVLHDAQYYLLTHKESPLVKLGGVDLSDFGENPLILCTELFRANQYILKYCTEQKVSLNVRLETGGFQAGMEQCRDCNGALLMADYIEDHIDIENFVRVDPKKGLFSLALVMLVRKDLEYSQMEHKFIEYMKAYHHQ